MENEEELIKEVRENAEKYQDNLVSETWTEEVRRKGWIEPEIFHKIAETKQDGRNTHHLQANKEEDIKVITEGAFTVLENGSVVKAMKMLKALDGVSVPTASALLAVYKPEEYPVIDFQAIKVLNEHGWEEVDWRKKPSFIEGDYIKYCEEIRRLAEKADITPRKFDLGLYLIKAQRKLPPLKEGEN